MSDRPGPRRPPLRAVPLSAAWPPRRGTVTLTMYHDQWDELLQAGYGVGCVLVEVDDDEAPVAAYCKDKLHPLDN